MASTTIRATVTISFRLLFSAMIGRTSLAARPENRKIVTDPFHACLRIRRALAGKHMLQSRLSIDAARDGRDAGMPMSEVRVSDVARPVLKCAPMSSQLARHFAALILLVGPFTVCW